MDYYPFYQTLEARELEMKVRLSIFIIAGVCAGLPALAWSVREIINHRKNGHRISFFIILLLFTDVAELFISPYILIRLLLDEISCSQDWTCLVVGVLLSSSKDCGFVLNQLVALEGILSVKYPTYTTTVFSSPFFTNLYMYAFLFIILSHVFFHTYVVIVSLFVVSLIPYIILCSASCCDNRDYRTSRKSDGHILIVFIFSLLIHLSFVLLNFIPLLSLFPPVSLIPVYVMSLRLISDPLLCVLVCRQNLSLQTSQKPQGLV